MNEIVMYGAHWCPDCRRAKSFLEENGVHYEYRDTELDEAAVQMVEQLNQGKRVIPTFEILRKTYANPDNATLASALGLNPAGRVVMYRADWCPDCRRAKSFLRDNHVNFQFIDVDQWEWATEAVQEINGGRRTIPTILIDGESYTNPDNPTAEWSNLPTGRTSLHLADLDERVVYLFAFQSGARVATRKDSPPWSKPLAPPLIRPSHLLPSRRCSRASTSTRLRRRRGQLSDIASTSRSATTSVPTVSPRH